MDTRKLWTSLTASKQAAVAAKAKTTPGYLYLIMLGHKRPSAELAKRICDAAKEEGIKISRSALRPDIWEAA